MVDYKSNYEDAPITPLYPFGYGLSYTTFSITEVTLDKNTMSRGGKITVTAHIKNTGKADGELITQLYIRDLVASVTRPVKELKGFQKTHLKAGESKQIQFEITEKDLEFYGIDMKKKAESGKFKLWIAQHSADNSNELSFELE